MRKRSDTTEKLLVPDKFVKSTKEFKYGDIVKAARDILSYSKSKLQNSISEMEEGKLFSCEDITSIDGIIQQLKRNFKDLAQEGVSKRVDSVLNRLRRYRTYFNKTKASDDTDAQLDRGVFVRIFITLLSREHDFQNKYFLIESKANEYKISERLSANLISILESTLEYHQFIDKVQAETNEQVLRLLESLHRKGYDCRLLELSLSWNITTDDIYQFARQPYYWDDESKTPYEQLSKFLNDSILCDKRKNKIAKGGLLGLDFKKSALRKFLENKDPAVSQMNFFELKGFLLKIICEEFDELDSIRAQIAQKHLKEWQKNNVCIKTANPNECIPKHRIVFLGILIRAQLHMETEWAHNLHDRVWRDHYGDESYSWIPKKSATLTRIEEVGLRSGEEVFSKETLDKPAGEIILRALRKDTNAKCSAIKIESCKLGHNFFNTLQKQFSRLKNIRELKLHHSVIEDPSGRKTGDIFTVEDGYVGPLNDILNLARNAKIENLVLSEMGLTNSDFDEIIDIIDSFSVGGEKLTLNLLGNKFSPSILRAISDPFKTDQGQLEIYVDVYVKNHEDWKALSEFLALETKFRLKINVFTTQDAHLDFPIHYENKIISIVSEKNIYIKKGFQNIQQNSGLIYPISLTAKKFLSLGKEVNIDENSPLSLIACEIFLDGKIAGNVGAKAAKKLECRANFKFSGKVLAFICDEELVLDSQAEIEAETLQLNAKVLTCDINLSAKVIEFEILEDFLQSEQSKIHATELLRLNVQNLTTLAGKLKCDANLLLILKKLICDGRLKAKAIALEASEDVRQSEHSRIKASEQIVFNIQNKSRLAGKIKSKVYLEKSRKSKLRETAKLKVVDGAFFENVESLKIHGGIALSGEQAILQVNTPTVEVDGKITADTRPLSKDEAGTRVIFQTSDITIDGQVSAHITSIDNKDTVDIGKNAEILGASQLNILSDTLKIEGSLKSPEGQGHIGVNKIVRFGFVSQASGKNKALIDIRKLNLVAPLYINLGGTIRSSEFHRMVLLPIEIAMTRVDKYYKDSLLNIDMGINVPLLDKLLDPLINMMRHFVSKKDFEEIKYIRSELNQKLPPSITDQLAFSFNSIIQLLLNFEFDKIKTAVLEFFTSIKKSFDSIKEYKDPLAQVFRIIFKNIKTQFKAMNWEKLKTKTGARLDALAAELKKIRSGDFSSIKDFCKRLVSKLDFMRIFRGLSMVVLLLRIFINKFGGFIGLIFDSTSLGINLVNFIVEMRKFYKNPNPKHIRDAIPAMVSASNLILPTAMLTINAVKMVKDIKSTGFKNYRKDFFKIDISAKNVFSFATAVAAPFLPSVQSNSLIDFNPFGLILTFNNINNNLISFRLPSSVLVAVNPTERTFATCNMSTMAIMSGGLEGAFIYHNFHALLGNQFFVKASIDLFSSPHSSWKGTGVLTYSTPHLQHQTTQTPQPLPGKNLSHESSPQILLQPGPIHQVVVHAPPQKNSEPKLVGAENMHGLHQYIGEPVKESQSPNEPAKTLKPNHALQGNITCKGFIADTPIEDYEDFLLGKGNYKSIQPYDQRGFITPEKLNLGEFNFDISTYIQTGGIKLNKDMESQHKLTLVTTNGGDIEGDRSLLKAGPEGIHLDSDHDIKLAQMHLNTENKIFAHAKGHIDGEGVKVNVSDTENPQVYFSGDQGVDLNPETKKIVEESDKNGFFGKDHKCHETEEVNPSSITLGSKTNGGIVLESKEGAANYHGTKFNGRLTVFSKLNPSFTSYHYDEFTHESSSKLGGLISDVQKQHDERAIPNQFLGDLSIQTEEGDLNGLGQIYGTKEHPITVHMHPGPGGKRIMGPEILNHFSSHKHRGFTIGINNVVLFSTEPGFRLPDIQNLATLLPLENQIEALLRSNRVGEFVTTIWNLLFKLARDKAGVNALGPVSTFVPKPNIALFQHKTNSHTQSFSGGEMHAKALLGEGNLILDNGAQGSIGYIKLKDGDNIIQNGVALLFESNENRDSIQLNFSPTGHPESLDLQHMSANSQQKIWVNSNLRVGHIDYGNNAHHILNGASFNADSASGKVGLDVTSHQDEISQNRDTAGVSTSGSLNALHESHESKKLNQISEYSVTDVSDLTVTQANSTAGKINGNVGKIIDPQNLHVESLQDVEQSKITGFSLSPKELFQGGPPGSMHFMRKDRADEWETGKYGDIGVFKRKIKDDSINLAPDLPGVNLIASMLNDHKSHPIRSDKHLETPDESSMTPSIPPEFIDTLSAPNEDVMQDSIFALLMQGGFPALAWNDSDTRNQDFDDVANTKQEKLKSPAKTAKLAIIKKPKSKTEIEFNLLQFRKTGFEDPQNYIDDLWHINSETPIKNPRFNYPVGDYLLSAEKGLIDAGQGIWNTVSGISSLLRDSAIRAFYIPKSSEELPRYYQNAMSRINERWNHLGLFGQKMGDYLVDAIMVHDALRSTAFMGPLDPNNFALANFIQGQQAANQILDDVFANGLQWLIYDASGPALLRLATGSIAPMVGMKTILMGKNFHHFGTFSRPPVFKPIVPRSQWTQVDEFFKGEQKIENHLLTLETIRSSEVDNRFIYIITENGKLMIMEDITKHAILSNFNPVIMAGEVEFEGGSIFEIDSRSGGFKPCGDHLEKIISHVFKKHGFTEAPGKYKYFGSLEPKNLPVSRREWLLPVLTPILFDLFDQNDSSENRINFLVPSAAMLGKYLSQLFTKNKEPEFLFRGDAKEPNEVFNDGIRSRGKNTDLRLHALPSSGKSFLADSAYVATSSSKDVALTFPKIGYEDFLSDILLKDKRLLNISLSDFSYFPDEKNITVYLYQINPQRKAIDVPKALTHIGDINPMDLRLLDIEKEIAIPAQIKPQAIKGAWAVNVNILKADPFYGAKSDEFFYEASYVHTRTINETFIPNPNYIPPLLHNKLFLGVGKAFGYSLVAIGLTLDGMSLFHEWNNSQKSGDFNNTYQEGARIVGGWSGGMAGGSLGAKAGSLLCAPLMPYGPIACGIFGGIVGSVGGYFVGSQSAIFVYSSLRDHPQSVIKKKPYSNGSKVLFFQIPSGKNFIKRNFHEENASALDFN